jgi:hypothetical protein
MNGARWSLSIGLVFVVFLFVTWGCGLPPLTWVEKGRYISKAETALKTVSTPTVPVGLRGDVFTYPDGWLVVMYGESRWTGHNIWNYNLAKDSSGGEYLSERHFCLSIRQRYDQRMPNLQDPELDQYKALIEARTLADATRVLVLLGFTKR